jgi:hypothetical protein
MAGEMKVKKNSNHRNDFGKITVYFISLFSVLCFLFSVPCRASSIKEPNVAGTFYPADAKELSSALRGYLDAAGSVDVEEESVVLIVPHAGYIYSGPVAAYAYQAVAGKVYDTVVILAASHFFPFRGASVYPEGVFKTPLGDLDVDAAAAAELLETGGSLLAERLEYFDREHSLEVQLPFLQEVLKPGFKILPILTGDMSYEECVRLAKLLASLSSGRRMLIVASTDLSHYKTYGQAQDYDAHTIAFLEAFDTRDLWDAVADTGWNVCGIRPVVTAMEYAKQRGALNFSLLKYANSGDTAGDKSRVVGYLSAVITKEISPKPSDRSAAGEDIVQKREGGKDMLTVQDKKRLLEIARQTIAAHTAGRTVPVFKESGLGLNLKRGCFVTLREHENLRGCIGLFSSDEPLFQVVRDMAIASSSQDYRFSPLRAQELDEVTIEISVLSEPVLIDDWRKIRLGTDGVIVRRAGASGVFLPQVATETGWNLETFLGELCSQKAGLPTDSYKDPQTKIYTFQADVFSEDEVSD